MTNDIFRESFPEFQDTIKYPNSMLTFWSSVAGIYVDIVKWGTLADTGLMLALAHHLVIAANNQAAAGPPGGTPGGSTGLINNMGVGDVSVGFDTQATTLKDGDHWNLTDYGRQYLRMARMIGGCARQV